MTEERNDFGGPIGDRGPWEEFSTEFLSKIMALWQEQWKAFTEGLVRVGSQMENVGQRNAGELLSRVKAEVAPPDFAWAAEIAAESKADRLKTMRQW